MIGLYPIDSKMANLALMKISSWVKQNGNISELFMSLNSPNYKQVYVSKVFDYSSMPNDIMCDDVIYGGTGHDITTQLPYYVEECSPDYSIYPNCDYTIQLFSRGCIRKCKFCVVPQKEGGIRSVEPMIPNPNGKWVEVFDNNFFANPKWREAIEWLSKYNQPVNFHGIDARILTDDMCRSLMTLKHKKQIHTAWDNIKDKIKWDKIIKIIPPYKIMVYVLIGYNSTEEEDLHRINTLREHGIDPFVMPFNKNEQYQKRFARWVNHKAIFKTVEWEAYGKYSKKEQHEELQS